jgi:glycosyltransferase involved in cell wall biosynthesis
MADRVELRDLYGEGDAVAAAGFAQVLDEFRPDLLHLHAFTSAVSVRLADEASRRSIPIVLTYHTPTVSCTRGTLLRWGAEICDGRLDVQPCTACAVQGKGVRQALARLVAMTPPLLSSSLRHSGFSGGIWTALQMPELIRARIHAFRRMVQLSGRVVAPCEWVRQLLIRNGVPEDKIMLCRQGISWQSSDRDGVVKAIGAPLKAVFLGRLDAIKGAAIVVEALRRNADLAIQLDLFGIRQGHTGNQYEADLQRLIAEDERIRLLPSIPPAEVIARLKDYDVLLVPSQWLETGPLVVLEAFAAKTPVIGSKLGGIAELVTDGVDMWANALRRVAGNSEVVGKLRNAIRPPRHAREVAAEMQTAYNDLILNHQLGAVIQ